MSCPEQMIKRLYEPGVDYTIPDPGASGAIEVDRQFGQVQITTAAAETRTLADPHMAGLVLSITLFSDGGDCTITTASPYNRNGDTTIVLDTESQTVVLLGIEGTTNGFEWEVISGISAAALTTALTDLSGPGATPGTPDYAIQAITSSTPFGFVTADEAETVISVVQANKVRIAELEAALQAVGILA